MKAPSGRRTAVLSDVHANLEAIEAVLDDIAKNGCDRICCLGDQIGYGPNPRQTLRIAIDRFDFTLMGNHEDGVLRQPVDFNWKAEASTWWTKDQMRSPRHGTREGGRLWSFLEEMPRVVQEGDTLFVHASPLDPIREYVMPEACYNTDFMKHLFSKIKRVAFNGHTHMPGIFTPNRPFLPQSRIVGPYPLQHGKFLVNVGSVGQSRDGDTRACYAIFNGREVTFRRVPYNFRKTARKIKHIKGLPYALGVRLTLGL